MVGSIFEKSIDADREKQGIETSSDLHKHTQKHLLSEIRDHRHPYKVIHTPSKVVWSSRPHKFQEGWKVFISLTDRYKTFIDEDCGMTQSIAFIRCASKQEAMARKRELDNPLFRFLNDLTRYGNFNNNRGLQRFPRLFEVKLGREEKSLVESYGG